MTKQGAKQRVSWDSIHAQFGSQYSDVKDFRKKAMAALKKIVQTQPELKLTPVPGYIEIHPGVPVIPAQSAQ